MAAPRFCIECGSALPQSARFCPQCGHAVGTDAAGPGMGERRQVAVMFADLAGFTALASTLDPEEVHSLLGRFFDSVDGVVAAHGGAIDKHIGDAVMAVFGAPVAHDNDAERAVHAACEVHRAVASLAAQSGRALAAHIGIASGEVVAAGTGSARHSEYTVTGDAVNLASRLDSLAKSGETLVSEPVWRAISHRFAGESAGSVAVKGLTAPVEAWRVLHAIDASAEEPPLAGRRNELAQLRSALAAMRASGSGCMVVLRGEAGIGKTRLAAELRRIAQSDGVACHAALVLDFGVARGRGAVAAIAAQLLGAGKAADPDARAEALERALDAGEAAQGDEAFLRDLLDLAQPADLRAAYEAMEPGERARGRLAALRALAAGSAGRQPRLLLIEDAHWADAPTLDGIATLGRASASAPLLLVVTTRTEGDPFDARWRAQAGPLPLSTLDLAPLAADEALLIANAFAAPAIEFVHRCVERADGNPLFLVQLLRNAGESATVPASIQSLVLSRIDRLPPADRAAIQAAAVIGQRFSLPALRHVAGVSGQTCDALVDHHLVRAEGDEYLFAHALICDGAYASLLHSRKRGLHARAAAWYAGRDARLHAVHLDRAGDPGASAAYLAAARELEQALRAEEAVALAERGIALAPDRGARFEATMLAGGLLRAAGRTQPSIAMFGEAAALAPDAAARCRALLGVAAGHRLAGEPDQALDALAQAEPLAQAPGLVHERATIHHTRGNLHFARGDVDACLAEHEASLAAAREADDVDAEAGALSGLGDARYAQGRMRSAYERFDACVALARQRGLIRVEAANVCMRGHSRTFLNEWDAALDDMRAGLALAQRLRDPHLQVFTLESLAVAHLGCGDAGEAGAQAGASLEIARAIGSRRYEAVLLWVEAQIALARGDRALARDRCGESRAIVSANRIEGFMAAPLCATLARASDDPVAALRLLDEGEAWLERGSVGHCHFWFRRDAIDAALAIGDLARVLRQCDALQRYTHAEPLPWSDFHVARGRTSVEWRRSRSQSARDALHALHAQARGRRIGGAMAAIEAELAAG